MDVGLIQTFPLSVRWRTGWRKISGNCINTIFCRDSFCTCWTYHTRDHRSARLTFSTICIQFSNISRSQEKCITDVHFFGSMSWSYRSLLRDFPRTFLQMHPKVVVVREGVKILEIFVRSFAREDSCKVFCLRSLFCPLYQDPHITWCQVFKNLIQVELPVEICSLEALLFSQTLPVQSHAVKLWAVTNLKLTWKRYLLVESK